ncbi:MAG: patatin-like phospholipase family protein [Deltaproteobacteria bacterium]|nr:patatin-like phospholipase family protein [Deltaproteobacteria bacterium]MBW2165337.1 patatin-like phospholipase family protein [Deltaproteobacteria bacterium]
MEKIGIALGAGGARGLAHILMLETLDELGLKPAYISGASIGAIAGLLYCSGMTGKELRELLNTLTVPERNSIKNIFNLKWLDFIMPKFDGAGLLKAENFINFLFGSISARTFEELDIPLFVVTSNFWTREEVVFKGGELVSVMQASISLPGIFAPVLIDDKVLIDGGAVNPVPFDILPNDCDLTIAIDVIGHRTAGPDLMPSLMEAVFNTFQIMEKSITRQKLRVVCPDIYIEPYISDVRVLEFHKAEHIFRQAQPAKDQLKRELEKRLNKIDAAT